jgi:hypothetical protein
MLWISRPRSWLAAAVQDRHVVAAPRQVLDDFTADEQRAADHENVHAAW